MNTADRQHFILVKREDHSSAGARLSARAAADRLLDALIWPLWAHTPCRKKVRTGDAVAVYLAGPGNRTVIATADVIDKIDWQKSMLRSYPLVLSGTPTVVLRLGNVRRLVTPLPIAQRLDALGFISRGPKWGAALMGGMRSLSHGDFSLLTTPLYTEQGQRTAPSDEPSRDEPVESFEDVQ